MHPAYITVEKLSVLYDNTAVLNNISLAIPQGAISGILGPSGAGKSSLVMAISGFVNPEGGTIIMNGAPMWDADQQINIAPEYRDTGVLFQDLALFPHMTIRQNIAFGIRHKSADTQLQRVADLAQKLRISAHLDKYQHQLSGGQQQRAALARTLAPSPRLVLLDEPFSSQDSALRNYLSRVLRTLMRAEQITGIVISHDQIETLHLCDYVGVISNGNILQWDAVYNVYHKPVDRFVASFVGQGVFLPAIIEYIKGTQMTVSTSLGPISGHTTTSWHVGDTVDILIRPDDVCIDPVAVAQLDIIERQFHGANFLYTLAQQNVRIYCNTPSHQVYEIGSQVGIRFAMVHLVCFPTQYQ